MKRYLASIVFMLINLNGFCQIEIKSICHAKTLIQGKWDIYEYCIYEAHFCKNDSSGSIIFRSVIGENKLEYSVLEKGVVKKEGVVGIYDFIKVRTTDKYTLDNFLFSTDNALIISFLNMNKLSLLQNSFQGYAKHYRRDTTYKVKPILLMNSDKN